MTENTANQTHPDADPFLSIPPLAGIDDAPGLIVARPRECPTDYVIDWHTHRRAQLLYAARGVMQVTADKGMWIVPPHRAVWIPPGIAHHVRAKGAPMSLRSIYIHPSALDGLPQSCCVVTVSPLLRELILAAMDIDEDFDVSSPDARLALVLLDQIRTMHETPLHLPTVADAKLRKIADAIINDPADPRTLKQWGAELGATERTLARAFQRETAMTFGQWRQQARLLAAMARLAHGDSVTDVAFDLGYASQSAFIGMFRRAVGKTPGRYFSESVDAD